MRPQTLAASSFAFGFMPPVARRRQLTIDNRQAALTQRPRCANRIPVTDCRSDLFSPRRGEPPFTAEDGRMASQAAGRRWRRRLLCVGADSRNSGTRTRLSPCALDELHQRVAQAAARETIAHERMGL